ncbi:hypothetical protein SAMN04515618_11870 [Collimonas sp. OK307]|nr:hypothetical protein SAMN04515618_11870 [Collimonas sp. OK307]
MQKELFKVSWAGLLTACAKWHVLAQAEQYPDTGQRTNRQARACWRIQGQSTFVIRSAVLAA